MKKYCLPLLLIVCLVLTGCSTDAARDDFDRFLSTFAEKEALGFRAELRCEYVDKTFSFTVDCQTDTEGCAVTVVEPELIRGISARLNSGETTLEYGSIRLDTGPLDAFGLCPMSAMPLMINALGNAYVDSVWEENGEICALLVPSDELKIQIWIDKYTLEPIHAQLISGEQVKVYADITNWI